MSYDFNADDVFEMAEQIEKNGAIFYRQAAADVSEEDAKTFLLDLAAMEDDHEKTFSTMRKTLSEKEKTTTVFDPNGEAAGYLKALADTRIFFEKEIDTSSMQANAAQFTMPISASSPGRSPRTSILIFFLPLGS